ncbi:MAG TPA: FecR family protein [Pyrinomonadaceae bacterium]|nr:FecR family protein [Pyrinomonadaceae bacterium]
MHKTSTPLHFLLGIILLSGLSIAPTLAQGPVSSQSRERFVISARAGGVNAVTGKTGVYAKGSNVWEPLTIKDNLERGDVVKTGLDGRVEILLNPGSYMRVGENSEFELTSNTLDNLEVRVIRGTAIVEATGADDTELMINITTPHAKMAIVRRGLYRVNVVPGDLTEVIVRKGRMLLSDPEAKINGGKKLIFSGNSYSVAKLTDAEKKEVDSFDIWSKDRAQTIAKANQRIGSGDRRMMMRTGFFSDWAFRFSPRVGGIWFYDRSLSCYTFLPFYSGWGSPYGNSYSQSFYKRYPWRLRDSFYDNPRSYFPSASAGASSSGRSKDGPSVSSPSSAGRSCPKTGGRKFPD